MKSNNPSFSLCETTRKYVYYAYYNNPWKLQSRERKKLLRIIFNHWYKTPNKDGIYNEDYWKLKFDDGTFVRVFLFDNVNGLPPFMANKLIGAIFEHRKYNLQKTK